jgi:hypothetical protein
MKQSDWNHLDDKVNIFLMEDGNSYFEHCNKALGTVMDLVLICKKASIDGKKQIPLKTIYSLISEEMS